MEKTFVVILASFNMKCYDAMVRIRIAQMRKRGIDFHFLINGDMPSDLDLRADQYTVIPGLSVDKLSKNQTTPWATRAFQDFLRNFYVNVTNDKYDYILRLNVSTFVNFDKFLWMLQFFPKEKLLGGPFFVLNDKIFCNGTAMIFSKDVAKAFAYETILNEEFIKTTNDDVAISWSLMDRYFPHDTNYFYRWIEKYREPNELNDFFVKNRHQHVFFRVKNEANRDVIDTLLWQILYQVFG